MVPTANEAETSPFSNEQMDHLLKLLKSTTSFGIPSVSLAQTGSALNALSCCLSSAPWIIDCGASDHMTSLSNLFSTYSPCSGLEKIKIADGSFSPIAGKGLIKLSENIDLKSVLHVPKLVCNLLSVSKLTKESNCRVIFCDSYCEFQDRNSGKRIGSAKIIDGLYYFDGDSSINKKAQGLSSVSSTTMYEQIMLWHLRLGHPSFPYLKHLFPTLFRGLDFSSFYCESCCLSKSHRTTYLPKPYTSSKPFYLIHSDVWGPSRVTTISRKKWFVTFIDDHTHLCWVYLMNEKSEVETIFKNFYTMVETQFQVKISIFHTDNGIEYLKDLLGSFLKEKGIHHQSSCVDTPQQNGIVERKNKHLLEVARAIMFSMNVQKYLWREAVLTASYLINRMPTRALRYSTPLDCLKKKKIPLSRIYSDLPLKVFGCIAFVHIPNHTRSKLDPRAEKCVFIGYASNKKGYKCYNPPKIFFFYVSMDVSSFENKSYFHKNSLQGENEVMEGKFWDLSPTPLPNIILTTSPHSSHPTVIPEIQSQEQCDKTNENNEGNPSHIVPNITVSEVGGESLQPGTKMSNTEPLVYTRRRPHQKSQNQPIPLGNDQSRPSVTGSPDSSDPNSFSVPIASLNQEQSDLDILIVVRKGTRTLKRNPKYPIAKYLSYEKLSHTHRAFT